MRDIKELCVLLPGFTPWLLFLFLAGHSMSSLKIAIIISLLAALAFGFGDLKRGFILTWGTLIFFCFCAVFVNILNVTWVATYMDLLSKTTLATIMWLTILMGKPFALQYAQKDAPKERWGDQKFIQGCRFISLTWAYLMSLSVGLRREAKGQFKQGLPNKANPWRRIEVKGRSGVTHWRYIIGITLRPTQIRQNRSI